MAIQERLLNRGTNTSPGSQVTDDGGLVVFEDLPHFVFFCLFCFGRGKEGEKKGVKREREERHTQVSNVGLVEGVLGASFFGGKKKRM